MYADDVKIYSTISEEGDVKKLQLAINQVEEWSTRRRLPLAIGKCHVLPICNGPFKASYHIGGKNLECVKEVRDLGFLITDNLCFTPHYRSIVNKATARTYNLFKALKSKDPKILIRAYKTYIRPIVESGTTVFNPHLKKDIRFLESVQNNFTRKLMLRCSGVDYRFIPNGDSRSKLLGLSTVWKSGKQKEEK